MFSKPFSFEGRIRRTEYGLSFIIYLICSTGLSALAMTGETIVSAVVLLCYIPLIWFMFAQGAKRCHDRGNTGFFQLIPFYGFWMLFAEGEQNINEYGPNPKNPVDTNHKEVAGV